MNRLTTLLVLSILMAPLAAAGDISGDWDLDMAWQESGTHSTGVCTFRHDAQTLTGTCGGTDRFPIAGEVNGNRITWQAHVTQGEDEGRMSFTGELDEGATTIKGTCRIIGGQRGTFTMKKR